MKSIGQELTSARKKRALSLKEVEETLKIRLRFLEALENDDFDVLPGKAYVKGFIRSYASFLKIDPIPLVEEYKKMEPEDNNLIYDSAIAKLGASPAGKPRLRIFTASAAILTIIFIMTSFLAYLGYKDSLQSQRLNDKKYVDKELRRLEKPQEEKARTDEKAREREKNKKEEKAKKDTDLFKIKIVVTEGSWVRLKAERKTFFSKYVKDGESQTFISRRPVEVTASKGTNVKVFIDGTERGPVSDNRGYSTYEYKKDKSEEGKEDKGNYGTQEEESRDGQEDSEGQGNRDSQESPDNGRTQEDPEKSPENLYD